MPTSDILVLKTLHTIAIWVNLNAGILLFMGGIWNSKDLSGTGFGIGMAAWILLIITSFFDIIWSINKINTYEPWSLISLATINFSGSSTMYILMEYYVNMYQYIFVGSIFGLSFGIACLVLGSVSFGLLKKRAV